MAIDYKIGYVTGHPDGDDLLIKATNGVIFDLRLAGVYAKELSQRGGATAKRLLASLVPVGTKIMYHQVGSNRNRKVCSIKVGGRLFNESYNNLLKKKKLYGGNGVE